MLEAYALNFRYKAPRVQNRGYAGKDVQFFRINLKWH